MQVRESAMEIMGKNVLAAGTTNAKALRQDQDWCVSHNIIIIIILLPVSSPSRSSLTHTLQPNELAKPLQTLLGAHAFVQATLHAGMPLPFFSNSYSSFKTQLKGLLLREAFFDLEPMAVFLAPFCYNF